MTEYPIEIDKDKDAESRKDVSVFQNLVQRKGIDDATSNRMWLIPRARVSDKFKRILTIVISVIFTGGSNILIVNW